MAYWTQKTSGTGPFYVDLYVTLISQNVAANTSRVSWTLIARSTGGSPTWSGDAQSWSVNIGGATGGGTWILDFRSTNSITVASFAALDLAHNSDGTLTFYSVGSLSTNHTSFGSGSAGGWMTLPRIPRGPRVNVGGATWRNSVAYVNAGGGPAGWRVVVPYVYAAGRGWVVVS